MEHASPNGGKLSLIGHPVHQIVIWVDTTEQERALCAELEQVLPDGDFYEIRHIVQDRGATYTMYVIVHSFDIGETAKGISQIKTMQVPFSLRPEGV